MFLQSLTMKMSLFCKGRKRWYLSLPTPFPISSTSRSPFRGVSYYTGPDLTLSIWELRSCEGAVCDDAPKILAPLQGPSPQARTSPPGKDNLLESALPRLRPSALTDEQLLCQLLARFRGPNSWERRQAANGNIRMLQFITLIRKMLAQAQREGEGTRGWGVGVRKGDKRKDRPWGKRGLYLSSITEWRTVAPSLAWSLYAWLIRGKMEQSFDPPSPTAMEVQQPPAHPGGDTILSDVGVRATLLAV